MSKFPLVSVIITNYNYARYVGEAIQSVLDQTYKNLEIIIIDDGSTDESDSVIKKYTKHKKVKYLPQENVGIVSTRNRGLDESKGDFFVFLDADDTIPVNFIEEMYRSAKENKADVVYCDLKLSEGLSGVIEIEGQSIENFLDFKPTPVCQLVRRSIVGDVTFDEHLDKLAHEDNDFFFSLFLKGAVFARSNTFYSYRIHGHGRSPNINTDKHYETKIYLYEKYKNRHPKLKNPLVSVLSRKDSEIDKWHRVADERIGLIRRQEKMIKELEGVMNERDAYYESLINSKKYKVFTYISSPIATLKSKFSQEKKS